MGAPSFQWFFTSANGLINLLSNFVVPVLMLCALLVFLWGAVVFIARSGDEKAREEGKKRMGWGLVGLFVLVSLWGIVEVIITIGGVGPPLDQVDPPQARFQDPF